MFKKKNPLNSSENNCTHKINNKNSKKNNKKQTAIWTKKRVPGVEAMPPIYIKWTTPNVNIHVV